MCKIRFSNIFRSVTLDLTEEAVSLIREGRHPRTILSEDDVNKVEGRLSRKPSDWSTIFAFENDGSVLWVQPDPPARYMTHTHRVTA